MFLINFNDKVIGQQIPLFYEMKEQIYDIVKAYSVGKNWYSLVITIPTEIKKLLGVTNGTRFYVKIDDKGRIIYEPVKVRQYESSVKRIF